jgi:hypothetical protein
MQRTINMTKVVQIGNEFIIAVNNEIVHLSSDTQYGDRSTPVGYCRMVNGKPCGCTVAWVMPNGNCSCAPNDSSNPVCKCPQVEAA